MLQNWLGAPSSDVMVHMTLGFRLILWLVHCVLRCGDSLFCTLKFKAAGLSEEFVAIYQTTRYHIPEDRNINCENKCTCML